MADITHLFGGPYSPPSAPSTAPPEQQFLDAMAAAGIVDLPDVVSLDGRLHRFQSGTKGRVGADDKPGWYVGYYDGIPAGRFGCWRAGIEQSWRADIGRELSPVEELAHARRMSEARAARDAELERSRATAAEIVETIWVDAGRASADHPYLARKGIAAHGARITGDGRLVVPLYLPDGTLSSVQYIDHQGGKMYHPGGQAGGASWMIGTMDAPGRLYIAEGFATAATIHAATDRPCMVAYSASNLVTVAAQCRDRHGPAQEIVIVADHDASGIGQKYADQASAKYNCRVIMPPIPGMDANDYLLAGHDLAALLSPEPVHWLIGADDFCAQPAPVRWLVKKWIQADALIMVHGPSGGGKTFVVLDWCLRIASGMDDWAGHKVRPGPVVYLAGEGHHGMRGRIAAWKHHHKAQNLNMWVSSSGCDLNTPGGYQLAADAVRALPTAPCLIVVDTLHRFLSGDENSAQDAKTMLDACSRLMHEFGCAIVLVHHTGVNEEAQHRARGSSAWRGALDIEISIIPAKGDAPVEVCQRKSKDGELSESVYVELFSVAIPGWYDEDGEQVTSAVPLRTDAPVRTQKPTKEQAKIAEHTRTLEAAWWHSGAADIEGVPYVPRTGYVDYMVSGLGKTTTRVGKETRPSEGMSIGTLMRAKIIEPYSGGYIVTDDVTASVLMTRKNAD